MKNPQYVIDMVDYLYEEGDRDLIFFGQILGVVSYDENDNPFDKTPEKRMSDAIKLANYLISSDDFCLGKTVKQQDETYQYRVYEEGFQKFCEDVTRAFSSNGIDDVDLNAGIWLKKLKIGQRRTAIPREIMEMFE
ncbi:hypothetical protein RY831_13940 [Noviherbaspirillum sp. CPCC 100848]|uniref:Uncharacterized protein n=1 Tax=Noviherbaspirillum album TaxID=3080276 RepID=A0ABU6J9E3_9BURK|nr:hypothetical protein [Noviherbaspirillum sp. CPCC 100848]MEC4720259.1 hypothetical protein [Noviherbaspirillum sp. CPCC 100848]